jgi:general secretion pathway protein E
MERRSLSRAYSGVTSWHAVGCPECAGTGYRGRTGIHELLVMNDALQAMVHDGVSDQAIRDHARAGGMRTLREDGNRLVVSGVTSVEEVLSATRE